MSGYKLHCPAASWAASAFIGTASGLSVATHTGQFIVWYVDYSRGVVGGTGNKEPAVHRSNPWRCWNKSKIPSHLLWVLLSGCCCCIPKGSHDPNDPPTRRYRDDDDDDGDNRSDDDDGFENVFLPFSWIESTFVDGFVGEPAKQLSRLGLFEELGYAKRTAIMMTTG